MNMIEIKFSSAEKQPRRAWTDGLHASGQQEISVAVPWSEQDPRDKFIIRLFRFLEDYLASQPKRILPDQTLRYGWTTLRFVNDEHNQSGAGVDTLLIEELLYPFAPGTQSYIPGISRTMALLQLQEEAILRNRIIGDAIYPHHSQYALTCTRIASATIHRFRPLMFQRTRQPDTQYSGWSIGCCEQDHDHDNPDELAVVHLHHLVKLFPGLFPYLAMPVDTAVLFEETQTIVFRPGEENGYPDSAELLASLP